MYFMILKPSNRHCLPDVLIYIYFLFVRRGVCMRACVSVEGSGQQGHWVLPVLQILQV